MNIYRSFGRNISEYRLDLDDANVSTCVGGIADVGTA